MDGVDSHDEAPRQACGEGLALRPWSLDDVPFMVTMFNTSEMDRWTPLAHPFDEAAAVAYVERANSVSSVGSVQLALRAVLPYAGAEGFRSARLRIATDNVASQKVATAAGFSLTNEPLLRRERKGYVLDMATWLRAIT